MVELTSPSPSQSALLSESIESLSDSPHILLYSRSKVYIHPTAYSRDNIPGWLALVKRVRVHNLESLAPWLNWVIPYRTPSALPIYWLGYQKRYSPRRVPRNGQNSIRSSSPLKLVNDPWTMMVSIRPPFMTLHTTHSSTFRGRHGRAPHIQTGILYFFRAAVFHLQLDSASAEPFFVV
jgi:hypothetical protein